MKAAIKKSIKTLLFKSRAYKINAFLNRCNILMYHMVVDKPTGFYPEIATADFEKHIRHLSKNYTFISLDELVRRMKNNQSLRGCVVLTFDDGFKDNYTTAFPILKKYNAPATIFLTTGRIEDGKPPWFVKTRHVFMQTQKEEIDYTLDNKKMVLPLRTRHERFESATRVMAHLKNCPDNNMRQDIISRLEEELYGKEFTQLDGLMLTWDQIREMAEHQISMGAHTINHPVLSSINRADMEKEILTSKEIIEEKIHQPVTTFAYPFGKKEHYNTDSIDILKKLSIECAVTTEFGYNTHKNDLYQLNRYLQGIVKPYDFYWHPYSLSGEYVDQKND
jgi:peptidoglycan/xylan/chitin deacetylase (PgdA/CDA1 family)